MADYCTIAEVKARINKTNADFDTYGPTVITGVSRAIDNWCNRPDGFVADTVASARTYAGNGRPRMRIDECIEITLVEVKDSVTDSSYQTWASSDWIAFSGSPTNPDFNSLPYDQIMVDITGDESVFTSGVIPSRSRNDWYFRDQGGYYGRSHNPKYFYNPRSARGYPTVRVTAKWGYAENVPAAIKEAACMTAARTLKRYEAAMSNQLASTEMGQLSYELDPDIQAMLMRYKKPGGIGVR